MKNLQLQDLNSVGGVKDRYKKNEKNLVIMDTKNKIIQILKRVIDIQNDMRLSKFLQLYKRTRLDLNLEKQVYQMHQSSKSTTKL